jgi:Domain of unknown function (DUF1814).
MIHSSTQLKALVRNKAKGDSTKAQIIIRSYIMERFLERISLSKYGNNFVLKGGFLISSIVGLDTRSTMDIDGTIKNLVLTVATVQEMIEEIIAITLDDNTIFSIKNISEIMDDTEYGDIRISLDAQIDMMKTPLKVDISTGDVITPREVSYQYKLMFEDRSISIFAYNFETLLAEKLETVISRGTANTRLRDFYDLYLLQIKASDSIDYKVFKQALIATCQKRGSSQLLENGELILQEVQSSIIMNDLWHNYQKKYDYAKEISWDLVMKHIYELFISLNIL